MLKSVLLLSLTAFILTAAPGFSQQSGGTPAQPAAAQTPSETPLANPDAMAKLVPDALDGWKADEKVTKTIGKTNDAEMVTVGRTYMKEADGSVITADITFTDWVRVPKHVKATLDAWKSANIENLPDEYSKSVTVQGFPGREESDTSAESHHLWIIAGNRFFVDITLTGPQPADLAAWAAKIDLKKLAAVK